MFQLFYTSHETRPFAAPELKKLLTQSRLRNAEVGVTGMLVYHGGTFLQVLEGDESAVTTVFNRISRDPRHDAIHVLDRLKSPSVHRQFGEWSMGFADASGAARILKGYVDLMDRDGLSGLALPQAMEVLAASCRAPLREPA